VTSTKLDFEEVEDTLEEDEDTHGFEHSRGPGFQFSYDGLEVRASIQGERLDAVVYEEGDDPTEELLDGELDQEDVRERGLSVAYIYPSGDDTVSDGKEVADELLRYLDGRGPEHIGTQANVNFGGPGKDYSEMMY
jgi:hypothetical protein